MRARAFHSGLLFFATALGCGEKAPKSEQLIVPDACDGREAGIVCENEVALTCAQGDVTAKEDCAAQALKCDTGYGCGLCRPGTYECDGNRLLSCSTDGRSRTFRQECAEGTLCSPSGCADLCAEAEATRSYIGCEYWPVFTLNSQLDPVFRPAVVVGNPQLVPVHVKLSLGGKLLAQADVPAGETHTFDIAELPSEPLRSVATHSVLARKAAYRLTSNAPVTAHQFNPLQFRVEQTCARDEGHEEAPPWCLSHTNDASLLLPAHVLKREDGAYAAYLGVSRASLRLSGQPRGAGSGFLAVVAVGDRPVSVTISSTAHTLPAVEINERGEWVGEPVQSDDAGLPDASAPDAGSGENLDAGAGVLDDASLGEDLDAGGRDDDADSGEGPDAGQEPYALNGWLRQPKSMEAVFSPEPRQAFPALRPGETQSITLEPGDVFQLLSQVPEICPGEVRETDKAKVAACDPGKAYDLTGTSIQADGPVQLIGGHDCAFVPFNRFACDHLEESIFPIDTWGRRVIVGAPRERSVARPYRLRVVSGAEQNRITFTPEVHAPVSLGRGEWFELETAEDVQVDATRAMLVAQYLLGQGARSVLGDPSLSLVPPIEQYRNEYTFLSPSTYTNNYVVVVAPDDEDVVLDGDTLGGFSPIGTTGYKILTKPLSAAGSHTLHSVSGKKVGITLYGVGSYTSYMLPGGLDLQVLPTIY